jgi:biopolymer transport protein ExbD
VKKTTPQEEAISGVNIIPVIDVTLVLLVILLVLSPIINLPSIPVELPEAMTKETKDQNITVSLAADGSISVDTEIVTWDKFASTLLYKLRSRKDDAVVIVRADKSLPYGNVENFLRTVNSYVGNRAVAIATQQRTQKLEPVQQ